MMLNANQANDIRNSNMDLFLEHEKMLIEKKINHAIEDCQQSITYRFSTNEKVEQMIVEDIISDLKSFGYVVDMDRAVNRQGRFGRYVYKISW